MDKRPTADDYKRAAQIITERGWNQGGYQNSRTGAVCMLGAIYCARAERAGLKTVFDRHGDPRRSIEFSMPERLAEAEFGTQYAWEWNDTVAKNTREVAAKLRRLAKVESGRA